MRWLVGVCDGVRIKFRKSDTSAFFCLCLLGYSFNSQRQYGESIYNTSKKLVPTTNYRLQIAVKDPKVHKENRESETRGISHAQNVLFFFLSFTNSHLQGVHKYFSTPSPPLPFLSSVSCQPKHPHQLHRSPFGSSYLLSSYQLQ